MQAMMTLKFRAKKFLKWDFDVTCKCNYRGGILSTKHPNDDRKRYSDTLNSQVCEKSDYNQRSRQFEEEQQKRHFESWETFWGRPGYGAPKPNTTKGNLMKMLHYPDKVNMTNRTY